MLDLRIERDKDSQIEKARNLIKCVKFLFMACVWDLACAQRRQGLGENPPSPRVGNLTTLRVLELSP